MIAPLVCNFYLEPVDYLKDLEMKTAIVLRPSHPVRIRFVPIECEQFETFEQGQT